MSNHVRTAGSPLDRPWTEVGPPWTVLGLFGAAAWVYTVSRARAMGVGPGTMGVSFLSFTASWVAMMVAMMFPGLGPLAAGESAALTGRSARAVSFTGTVSFGAGFLVPWAVYGMVAFAAFLGTGHLVASSPEAARWLGVGIFALAGLYQFTSPKRAALEHCRYPMAAPAAPGSLAGGLVAGARDGAVCVGCCWALMAVFIASGAMNVSAMGGVAVVIVSEKLLPRPRPFTYVVGVALIALAVVAAVHPALLGGLRPAPVMSHMGGSNMGSAGPSGGA